MVLRIAKHKNVSMIRAHLLEHRWFWLSFATLCVPIFFWIISWIRASWFPAGDEAMIAIRIYDAWNGRWPLVGMRSTSTETDPDIMAFHPGPMQFYLFGLPYLLLGWTHAGLLIAGGIWLAVFLAIALWSGYKAAGTPGLTLVSCLVILLYGLFGTKLILPWNPWLAVMGLLTCLTLGWRMYMGDQGLWPLFMFCISYVGQAHLGITPVAVLLGAFLLSQAVIRWQKSQPKRFRRKEFTWALAVGLLCWLGPLINVIRYSPSNVSEIIALSRVGAKGVEVIDPTWVHITYLFFPWVREARQHDQVTVLGALVPIAAICILGFAWIESRRSNREVGGLEYAAKSGIILGLFVTATITWAGTGTGGGLRILFLDYMIAGTLFVLANVCFWLVIRLRENYPFLWTKKGRNVGIVAVTVSVLFAVFGPISYQRDYVEAGYLKDQKQARSVMEGLMPILSQERFSGLPVVIHAGGFTSWAGVLPSVGFELLRNGTDVHFPTPWPRPADDDFRRPKEVKGEYVRILIEDVAVGDEPEIAEDEWLVDYTTPILESEGDNIRIRIRKDVN